MARTNIDIDTDLVTEVVRRAERPARRLRRSLLSLEGVGWDGDFDGIRANAPAAW